MADADSQKATYQARLHTSGAGVDGPALLGALSTNHERIQDQLTDQAAQAFGPAWEAEVKEPRTDAGIVSDVFLRVRYPVRPDSAPLPKLQEFTAEIRRTLLQILDVSGLRAEVTFDQASVIDAPTPEDKPAWDRVAPVLAAVATGIGVLGFVTFVGGAIMWARFGAASLPPELALSALPTSDMVVVGARTLVPAIAWGLGACAVYLVLELLDNRGRGASIPAVAKAEEERTWFDSLKNGLGIAWTWAKNKWPFTWLAWLGRGLGAMVGSIAKNGPRAFVVGAIVTAAILLYLANSKLNWDALGPSSHVAVIGLGILAIAVSTLVAYEYDQFLYLAGTIFLSLSLFISVVAYVHATDHPRLRPAAIVRQNKEVIAGYLVAENADRVYLARVDLNQQHRVHHGYSRLVEIDKSQVSDIDVGPSMEPVNAQARATQLAAELCGLEPTAKRAAKANAATLSSPKVPRVCGGIQPGGPGRSLPTPAPTGQGQ